MTLSEFYIHAVLQAARAQLLGLDLDSAKSWGLNRAIFCEAAKKGYIGRFRRAAPAQRFTRKKQNYGVLYPVGGVKAFAVKSGAGLRFVIGGKEQTPEMFDRQIKRRFPDWKLVWSEAMSLMREAPSTTIQSASRFHKDIYKRWRLELAEKWSIGQSALGLAATPAKGAA